MRILPISLIPFKSMIVLNEKQPQQTVAAAPRDIANFTRETKVSNDGTKTTTERTKSGVLRRIETEVPNGTGTFTDYAEDGKTISRCGVSTGKGHQVITVYYPDGETLQSLAEINPDGTSTSRGYSPEGILVRHEKIMKKGRTVVVDLPLDGTKKVTQMHKHGISTATYFDADNNPKCEFDMVRGSLLRTRFYGPLGDYTETKFLEGGALETVQGRAEKVQIAGTTVYNNANGTRDFVTRNLDGSITLEPCDSDGLPLGGAQ